MNRVAKFLPVINDGLTCERCGAAELVENGPDLDCAGCGCPRVWLQQPRAALPDPCSWLGLVRLRDDRWRCVAAADTLARLWDTLQLFPLAGDLLCWPTTRRDAA
jgi:hypothetical protein